MRERLRWLFTLAGAMLVIALLHLSPVVNGSGALPVIASTLLQRSTAAPLPYSATLKVSYVRLPWYLMPPDAVPLAGRQELVIHVAVRDTTHFRATIHILRPILDRGTVSVVVQGREIRGYDSRTETASRSWIPAQLFSQEAPYLLTGLEHGLAPGFSPLADPSEAIPHFLAELRNPAYPFCLQRYARIVQQSQILNRPVDVIDFGPLETSSYITGCSYAHPGHCVHHTVRQGWGRAWVDTVHPFVLKYVQHGLSTDVHALDVPSSRYQFEVIALQFGVGPVDLQLHAPVPIVPTSTWTILSNSGGGSSGPSGSSVPAGFVPAGAPNGFRTEGTDTHKDGPLPRVTAVNLLFSAGHKVTTYVNGIGIHHPFGQYLVGPYVLIQERVRVHGLPTPLRPGQPVQIGRCQAWEGTSGGTQHWIAFAQKSVSVLISTNALSAPNLQLYVANEVCPR